jgi:hypothetical protein
MGYSGIPNVTARVYSLGGDLKPNEVQVTAVWEFSTSPGKDEAVEGPNFYVAKYGL